METKLNSCRIEDGQRPIPQGNDPRTYNLNQILYCTIQSVDLTINNAFHIIDELVQVRARRLFASLTVRLVELPGSIYLHREGVAKFCPQLGVVEQLNNELLILPFLVQYGFPLAIPSA